MPRVPCRSRLTQISSAPMADIHKSVRIALVIVIGSVRFAIAFGLGLAWLMFYAPESWGDMAATFAAFGIISLLLAVFFIPDSYYDDSPDEPTHIQYFDARYDPDSESYDPNADQ